MRNYFMQLQGYLEYQDKRIRELECALQSLSEEVMKMKEKPAVNVERIEYRFDQLKVETLDGTLNIGLNPNELQNMDEFKVNSQDINPPYLFPERDAVIDNIRSNLEVYMNTELAENLSRAGADKGLMDPSYIDLLKDDIRGQLPQRISQYLDAAPPQERSPDQLPQLAAKITERLKGDIAQALFAILNGPPAKQ
ncbi:spore germination protein GerPC [Peribacillus sp. SCS-26]|uniref:spore germination protein GerPC n=1 Tax=Paraperibacillus marinus TaxID=3115295 RepID=UPI0039058656